MVNVPQSAGKMPPRFGPHLRLPGASPLLFLLTFIPLLLLPLAVWQSVQSGKAATDINHSGSLRYRAMWLYGATALPFDKISHEV